MRFRPNRRASTDHAPGPIIASATPNAANTRGIDELLKWNKRRDSSAPAMNKPAMGGRITSASKAFRAGDQHARKRLRQWLCAEHKVSWPAFRRFPLDSLHTTFGLVRLEEWKRSFS
jgi:hypothetical protein